MSPRKSSKENALFNQTSLTFEDLVLAAAEVDGEAKKPSKPEYYTVGDVTRYLDQLISTDDLLGRPVRIRGELSNVKHSARGHIYFTLKDEEASISGIIWASLFKSLPFKLEDGLAVDITGKLEVYAPNGTYSLVSQKVEPVGTGSIQLAFEQLKARLSAEGLFDEAYKKALPDFPLKLGLVTSRTGAVIHDMLRVIRRKNPLVDVLLVPVKVQGEGASAEIAAAIKELNHPDHNIDVMIVARGGGSLEDLFCFSEEPVVRAIFASRVPVVTGIGHEPDFSLADAVSDYSASTPTAAAEMAVPDTERMMDDFEMRWESLITEMTRYFYYYEQTLDSKATEFVDGLTRAAENAERRCEVVEEKLQTGMLHALERYEQRVALMASSLDAFNPLSILSRGFSVASATGGKVIRSIQDVNKGEALEIRVADGFIQCEVTETHERHT